MKTKPKKKHFKDYFYSEESIVKEGYKREKVNYLDLLKEEEEELSDSEDSKIEE
jgi:hypothetical protein